MTRPDGYALGPCTCGHRYEQHALEVEASNRWFGEDWKEGECLFCSPGRCERYCEDEEAAHQEIVKLQTEEAANARD